MRILGFYKKHIISIAVIICFLFFQAMTDLALPDYMARIINNGIIQGDIPYIYKKGFQMLLLSLASIICASVVGYLAAKVAAKTGRSIRSAVFEKVSDFSSTEFNHFSTASLITRSTNDVQQIQMVTVALLRMVALAPMMGVGALLRAYNKSPSLSWTIALALILILCIMLVIFSITMPRFKLIQKLIDRLNLVMKERLSGIMVIRAFNTQEHERQRFDSTNKELTALNLFVNRTMAFLMPAMMLIMNLISILIVWWGSKFVSMGDMQIGDMLAFMQYAMQIIISFLMISMVFIMIPKAMVSAQRIGEVLDREVAITDPVDAEAGSQDFKEEYKGLVEFKNVSFRYPDAKEWVLENINFTAKAGEVTALIGSTGSGKSTLVNLIPRFYDTTEGMVLVEGVDVKKLPQEKLRDKIGYVPQKGILFSGTIKSNLNYGKEGASGEDLSHSAKIAQALDFILENEEGFEHPIAQGGTNVSGGQKQRLSIARALVKKPQFFIFDDSFSALDYKTDQALRQALKKETGESTILIVAQRISTIRNADKIIVLDDGKIAGMGKHDQLLKDCKVYQEIAMSQLPQEEVL